MAVSVDTVYQRVLAMANKEQRGYITPQEFNLFANQAQMEIFEQYFYDAGQFNRMPRDETPRADVVHLLEEKISIFKRRGQPIVIGNAFGDGTLPTDVYRLDNVISYNSADSTIIIEEITEDELVTYGQSPLAKPTVRRPVYLRVNATQVKIYPYGNGTNGTAVYFTQSGAALSSSTSINLTNVGDNYSSIKVGQTVIQGSIPTGTKVTAISGQTLTISSAATSGGTVVLTFASGDIKCNYIKRPVSVNWGYTEINGSALYNSASSTDFELHASEEISLVYKILALSGISLGGELYSIGNQEDARQQQQEKQ
tara:strand:+ start:831 stop:1766 length:936 start_codon:yes stop_codon:yes gene_type:complete